MQKQKSIWGLPHFLPIGYQQRFSLGWGIKELGPEDDHSRQFSAEFRMCGAMSPLPTLLHGRMFQDRKTTLFRHVMLSCDKWLFSSVMSLCQHATTWLPLDGPFYQTTWRHNPEDSTRVRKASNCVCLVTCLQVLNSIFTVHKPPEMYWYLLPSFIS